VTARKPTARSRKKHRENLWLNEPRGKSGRKKGPLKNNVGGCGLGKRWGSQDGRTVFVHEASLESKKKLLVQKVEDEG